MNEKKMGRWERSKRTIAQSRMILKDNIYLYKFPIVSIIASLLAFTALLIAGFILGLDGSFVNLIERLEAEEVSNGFFLSLFILMTLITTFIGIFFQGAMTYSISQEIDGNNSSFSDGISAANSKIGNLLTWTIATTTVGMVLRAIQERGEIIGTIAAGLTGLAWAVLSIFVIPVIMLENANAFEAIKRSTSVLKKTWGESLILNIGVGFIFSLIVLLEFIVIGAIAGTLLTAGSGVGAIVVAVLGVMVIIVTAFIQQMYISVFKVALYKYATTGEAPAGFDKEILETSIKLKKKKLRRGITTA